MSFLAWSPVFAGPAATKSPDWQFPSQNAILQTDIVAFNIEGKTPRDRINIPDFDILIITEKTRMIPLLRLLRLLGATGQLQDNVLTFKAETGQEASIDLSGKTLRIAAKTVPIKITIGNSDVTNSGEIYVPENILKDVFDLNFVWNEANYEYVIEVQQELNIFRVRNPHNSSMLSTKVEQVATVLPETEPPVKPGDSQKFLSFVQTELRADSRWHKYNDITHIETQAWPAVTFWGNVFNGYYRLRLAQNLYNPYTKIPSFSSWIDEGVWNSKHENFVMQVGDTNIGLSDLVAPGVNLFGSSFKWISKSLADKSGEMQGVPSRQYLFLSKGVIDGYAPLGATVELWVNNRLIQTKIVENAYNLKPGYGYYRFEGFGLLDKSLNEVKIVIKRQDGVVEEYYRNMLGTSQILPAGQSAILAGIGTRRDKTINGINFEGFFSGAQLYYGLLPNLTLGLTAATQEKFAIFTDEFSNFYRGPRGYHTGQQATLTLFDNFLIKEEFGYCYTPDSSSYATAFKTGVDYYRKNLKLSSQVFYYEPQYSNAVTSISDREGFVVSGSWQLYKHYLATGMFLYVHNNLAADLEHTSAEKLVSPGLAIQGLIPKSALLLRMDYSDRTGSPDQAGPQADRQLDRKYTAELTTDIFDKLIFDARYTFGDQINLAPSADLKYNLPVPGISRSYFYGKMFKLTYAMSSKDSFYATAWYSDLQQQAEISHYHRYYSNEGKYICNSRLDLGEVLTTHLPYAKAYLEFNLDETGSNRWGLTAGYDKDRTDYYYGLYISLTELFALHDHGLRRVTRTGIVPEEGGACGIVYLDLNGNGHRDKGEPGVPNIQLLIDGHTPIVSNKNGRFYIPRNTQKDSFVISIDVGALPAIYVPTQGQQVVYWKEGVFSQCALGVGVLNAVSGTVKAGRYNGVFKELSGMRVLLMNADQTAIIKDSITATDGTFYIGEIKPGNYILDIDMSEVPGVYEPKEQPFKITIPPSKEPTEIENCNINLIIKK